MLQSADPDPSMYGALPPGAWWEVANGAEPVYEPYGQEAGDAAVAAALDGDIELQGVNFAYPARKEMSGEGVGGGGGGGGGEEMSGEGVGGSGQCTFPVMYALKYMYKQLGRHSGCIKAIKQPGTGLLLCSQVVHLQQEARQAGEIVSSNTGKQLCEEDWRGCRLKRGGCC